MKGNQWPVQRSNQISKARTKLGRSEIEAVEEDSREDGLRVETLFLHRYTGRLILRASRNISRVDSTPPDKESRDCLRCGKRKTRKKERRERTLGVGGEISRFGAYPRHTLASGEGEVGERGRAQIRKVSHQTGCFNLEGAHLNALSAFSVLLCGIYTSK